MTFRSILFFHGFSTVSKKVFCFFNLIVLAFLTTLHINIHSIDYESEKIDLSDSRYYRDLSKPVGKLSTFRIFLRFFQMMSLSSSIFRLGSLYDRGFES